ncbi:MAG: sigma-54-dependent Fis family transcriptional regulator [Candidatus Scalindua sp.]|jgi:two-component system response regulator AtoC/two-component system nitrogen regulation response regulator NtrX|nr:sigma-54-dependent Fis family transcriptional regulator [Candidatus Scalindua sp.]MBT6047784.1 sigma-54-dependent Fis family transcriptional regulator [Candidatus Scalindua sp.]MBT6229354.1 sigma-54-dependent Fis family transcriptional regulator [Candidatus Scalindua sp.]MBT6561849.1 sigma-54-dependent Fis family transcriptional regulator [Candidatus Scalindua sp.]MBT7211819.1 sigma-54-dependent Fis family transcriptional regulator [Candidatus Scalindua sp.]
MEKLILIVDDEKAARFGMRLALEKDGYNVMEASDGINAFDVIKAKKPSLVFLDINMPKINGIQVLEEINRMESPPMIVIVTAYGSERVAVDAMKKGAYDYIAKPYEIDELRLIAKHAFEKLSLEEENARLRSEIDRLGSMGKIIGRSQEMKQVFNKIEKVGPSDVTVLIQGESGSGKELVAKEIHKKSSRKNHPMIIMNCAALPETLIESELFGHEKGAFTGATERRLGKFELADKGTIFLDEIGDMSPNTQAKVLRILQEQSFERLGGTETLRVDVRLISATHKDLFKGIKEGDFREDLYYRLKVVEILLPPLRNRREDIIILTEKFIQYFSEKHRKGVKSISNEAVKYFTKYPWPGNVRELQNVIESAVVMANAETLEISDFPEEIRSSESNSSLDYNLPFRDAKKIVVEAFERDFVSRKLAENKGNISKAAEALGMHRQSLQHKLKELNMK